MRTVDLRYSDGRYEMRECEPRKTLAHVEVSELVWDAYQDYLKLDAKWHAIMQRFDNEQFEAQMKLDAEIVEYGI